MYVSCDELYHHGVKGMKWGRRKQRDEEEDPILTAYAGHYMKKYKTYQRTRALYVCGKASKQEVDEAKHAAKNAAVDYRKRYYKGSSTPDSFITRYEQITDEDGKKKIVAKTFNKRIQQYLS